MKKDKKKLTQMTNNDQIFPITLPWLIIAISSMIMFMAFLISMYFEFHTAIFFAIWMWIISLSLFFEGKNRRKKNKFSGNICLCMGVVAFISGVVVLNI